MKFLSPPSQGRIVALDRFRGLALALMLMFGASKQFGAATDFFAALSTHDLSRSWQLIQGYGFYDVIAPMFVFAAGMAFSLSYHRRAIYRGTAFATHQSLIHAVMVMGMGGLVLFNLSDPIGIVFFCLFVLAVAAYIVSHVKPKWGERIRPILRQGVFLVGIGIFAINVVEYALFLAHVDAYTGHWGPLASIGFAMMVATASVRLGPTRKIWYSLCYAGAYLCLCLVLSQHTLAAFTHGGMLGALGYALLFVLGDTAYSLREDKPRLLLWALILSFAAIGATLLQAPSKEAVNCSYVLLSFSISFAVYQVIAHLDFLTIKRLPVLAILGQNSLTAYVLHFLVSNMYGIALAALVAYVPVPEVLHIILLALGMLGYAAAMAAFLRFASRRHLTLKL